MSGTLADPANLWTADAAFAISYGSFSLDWKAL